MGIFSVRFLLVKNNIIFLLTWKDFMVML